MKKLSGQHGLSLLAFCAVTLMVVWVSCHKIYPYKGAEEEEYECNYFECTTIVNTRKLNFNNLTVLVPVKPSKNVVKTPVTNLDYVVNPSRQASYPNDGLVNGAKAYSERNWKIWLVPPYLLGAAYILPRYGDKDVISKEFLEISYTDDVEGVYIAYDAVIIEQEKKENWPDWLLDYQPLVDKDNTIKIKKMMELLP